MSRPQKPTTDNLDGITRPKRYHDGSTSMGHACSITCILLFRRARKRPSSLQRSPSRFDCGVGLVMASTVVTVLGGAIKSRGAESLIRGLGNTRTRSSKEACLCFPRLALCHPRTHSHRAGELRRGRVTSVSRNSLAGIILRHGWIVGFRSIRRRRHEVRPVPGQRAWFVAVRNVLDTP